MKRGRVKRLGIALAGDALLSSCAPAIGYRAPGSVRSYDILVTRKDSLSREIGRGLKRRGYSVRNAVKGGGAPAVYLLWFTQREPEPDAPTWLYIRLADTRTRAIVAAVSAPRHPLGGTVEARAPALVS